MKAALYEIPVRRIDHAETTLGEFEGKVLLIVNVASQCGLTPQYEGLEKLHERYRDRGLAVLGFPANEFGAQEPGTDEEIQQFCSTSYGVEFPMFEKIVVKGEGQHPLYAHLTHAIPKAEADAESGLRKTLEGYGLLSGEAHDILWNFEKFLVDREGKVVARFAPDVTPGDPRVTRAIEAALG
ncbi:glutathione peroxidase [Chondromyces apiculatus]|uniref:Glutathione peroxidase n=1 Tax=Chondromyces apiculatus DSM 436 TaxID=1192034 RepID=A0A017TEU3_9BACT|nr:glutathione peroxidase [Chondromyces apiculatus]EYF07818.1 Glutathione peroxidase [Chondromyces apiculatus DSM 436]